jgi:hypothetical protein
MPSNVPDSSFQMIDMLGNKLIDVGFDCFVDVAAINRAFD